MGRPRGVNVKHRETYSPQRRLFSKAALSPARTVPRRCGAAGSMRAHDDRTDADDSMAGASSADEWNPQTVLGAYNNRASSACDETERKLLAALFPLIEDLDENEKDAFQVGIRNAIQWTRRAAEDAARDLQNEHIAATRKQLKAQSAAFQLKLEASRSAAKASLANQANVMEASHQRRLSLSLEEAQGPGDAASTLR